MNPWAHYIILVRLQEHLGSCSHLVNCDLDVLHKNNIRKRVTEVLRGITLCYGDPRTYRLYTVQPLESIL